MTPKKPMRLCGMQAWSCGSGAALSRALPKCFVSMLDGNGWAFGCSARASLVEALAAREEQAGAADEVTLEIADLLRRATELRQLVHAIIDAKAGLQMRREAQRHRREIPGHETLALLAVCNVVAGEQVAQQRALEEIRLVLREAARQDGVATVMLACGCARRRWARVAPS